ncbi:PASTA domain-containing protein [uncultured Alistipes sp.]|uniref:PASTA domain-containing protein n=1 Tax=uncultured Alistipes sp. TaxID=538949 RepID=UPI0026089C49|nr:PASTA domain-containing protein [uncultured Alistipes sp.]
MTKLTELWKKICEKPLLKHLLIIIGLLLVLGVVTHLLLLLGTRHNAARTVPDLAGIPIEEAYARADEEGLKIHINDSLYVPIYDGGIVLDQLPEKGVEVKPGRTVYVTINSYAQKMVDVPYVAGRSLRQAKNMLEVAGLGIEKLVYRPDMATNYVLEQYVDGKKISNNSHLQAEMGSGVTLYVGESGYTTTLVPKVVGLRLNQAKSRLWEQGLNVGEVSFAPGINLLNQKDAQVHLQSPSAGSPVRLGTSVRLTLTLDNTKVGTQSAAADKQMQEAAEKLRKMQEAEADSLARAQLDSLANVVKEDPFEEDPNDDGLFDNSQYDEFFE